MACRTRRWKKRCSTCHWLAQELAGDRPTIVGIDHALSFPLRYFEVHRLPPDWMGFLEDFHRRWLTDAPHTYVDFILNGSRGEGSARMGNSRWMRLTDERCRAARSVSQFEGQGKVAAATHAGLPWILFLKRQLGERLHVWPFDGWDVSAGKSALVEVRPALWRISWAGLLKRVFDIDMQHCPNCGAGELKIIAAILDLQVIEKILGLLGLDPQPPPKGRAREVGPAWAH